ncbi:MAG: branched-chain amino acid ABC transporter permease [Hyphomicrobiaceae bacterium]|nr:MAG: branched-chain amino acid ABC transporter permease [Hyphomicrobiaceae bacterium]
MDDYLVSVLSNIGIISFVALSAYVLLLAGEVSFGQQAFFALGAYAAGIATAMLRWPLALALCLGVLVGALAAAAVGRATLRLSGLYFAMATLAFAEMMRIGFELFTWQVDVGGSLVGPNGPDGFGDIRYLFENEITPAQYMLVVYGLLAVVLAALLVLDRSRWGRVLRQAGADPVLAELQGIRVVRVRLVAAAAAGALAGLGGGLYAHLLTYVEPRNFDIMLGVHSLAYGLIGGLGTAFGPVLGVLIDIGLLESSRLFQGYRMIAFGGLVAVLLIARPRGLLDERAVHWISSRAKGLFDALAARRLDHPFRRR